MNAKLSSNPALSEILKWLSKDHRRELRIKRVRIDPSMWFVTMDSGDACAKASLFHASRQNIDDAIEAALATQRHFAP